MRYLSAASIVTALCLVGCTGGSGDGKSPSGLTPVGESKDAGDLPSFSLAWSEYPSWSVFGVADELKLIDGDKGKIGSVEEKWGVDIELKEHDYDTCLSMYGSGVVDAVCITNMDILSPSLGRKSVAVLPTSTSKGADACIVVGIDDVQALRGEKVYGLDKSVSEYTFARNLEILGEKESDHQFTSKDPGAAAMMLQTGQAKAVVVWNPFVIQSLKKNKEAKVLFSSEAIPGEIVDMVVASSDTLSKAGGANFASAVADAFYEVNKRMADATSGDATLVAIGAKFSDLQLEDMKEVVKQTVFYKTPDEAKALFSSAELKSTMERVAKFCVDHDMVKSSPTVAYGSGDVNLLFDPKYIQAVVDKK